MTITRESIRMRHNAGYTPNTITVSDNHQAWSLRFHYKSLRNSGASMYAARSAIYDMLFLASLGSTRKPVFTSGIAA